MRRAQRWRYFCDFCDKVGGSAFHMRRHEAACTANPHRACGYCGAMRPVAELVALLVAHAPDWHAGMAALRLEARGCPGCILAATRQTHAIHPGSETSWEAENREYKLFGFDYGYERAVWWLAHPRPVRPSAGPSLAEILAMIVPMGNEDVQMATPGMQRLLKPGVFDQRDMAPGDEIISPPACSKPASKGN